MFSIKDKILNYSNKYSNISTIIKIIICFHEILILILFIIKMNTRNFTSQILILFILVNYILSDETGSSIRAAIPQKSIDFLKDHLIPTFLNETTMDLKDINMKQHIDFLGTIKLNLTDNKLTLDKISSDQIEILLLQNSTININLKELQGVIDFKYSFKSGFDDREGTGNITIQNIQIGVSSKLLANQNLLEPNKLGPMLIIEKIDLISAKIEIKFNDMGKLEKLIQYLVVNIQNAVLTLLQSQLSGDLLTTINSKLFAYLTNMPLYINIPNTNLTIDYSLTESPQVIQVAGNYLELCLNASIMSKAEKISYDGEFIPVPEFQSGVDSILTYLNEFVIQSALYTLFKQNKLDFFLNSEASSILTTSSLGLAIPELYEHYGVSLPVDAKFDAKDYPRISLNLNKTKIVAEYITDLIVKVNDTYSETALTLDLSVIADFNLILNNGVIQVALNSIKLDQISVLASLIGEIQSDLLATNLNNMILGFKKVIESTINEKLSKIKIPSFAGISLDKSTLYLQEGYFQLNVQLDNIEKKSVDILKFLDY